MADQLESLLVECKVDPSTASSIVLEGWTQETQETFAICASSPDDLDQHWDYIAPGLELSFQQKAC